MQKGTELRNRFQGTSETKRKANIVEREEEMPLLQFPEELEQDGAASSSGEHSPTYNAADKIEQIRESAKQMITKITNMCNRSFKKIFSKEAPIFATAEEATAKLKQTQQELTAKDSDLLQTIKSIQDEALKIKVAFTESEEYVIDDPNNDKRKTSQLKWMESPQRGYEMYTDIIQKDYNALATYCDDISLTKQEHVNIQLLGDL